jgi:hypothetical protein
MMSESREVTVMSGIAVEVPKIQGVTKKRVGGLEIPEVKTGLQELAVVFPARFQLKGAHWCLEPGMKLFVSTQALMAFDWAKQIYEIDGKTFIVVPVEFATAYSE